ncbi:MAG: hypothetical protein LBI04_00825 [Treponema sp.]|jgi:hypothetical protein|nr:hypothetical protein [Treponema sp.]
MEKIITALLESIRALEIEAVLAPQQVSASRPRIDLYFAGLELAGIDRQNPEAGNGGWERIIFNAEFRSDGTHSMWVNDTITAARKLLPFNEKNMPLTVTAGKDYKISAHWRRLQPGRFEYPNEEDSSMPVRYVELWQITVAYPANIIGQDPEE